MKTERTKEDLSPQELAFCEFYTALGEPTCGNGTQSALKSGYSEKGAHTTAWKLLQRPAIKEKIREIHDELMAKHNLNPSRILYDLEHTRLRALDKGDLSVAARCSELQGKHLTMFSDKYVVDDPAMRELTEAEEAEARKIAAIRLRQTYLEEKAETDNQLKNTG